MNGEARRSLLISLLLVIFVQLPAGPIISKNSSEEPQEVFLSFRYRNLLNTVVIAYYEPDNKRFYLPLDELMSILKINHSIDSQTLSATVNFFSTDDSFLFNLNDQFVQTDKRLYNLSAEDFLIRELDYYLHASLFEEILGLNFTIDFNNLKMHLETNRELPLVLEFERKRQRQSINDYSLRREQYDLLFERDRKLLGGGFLDYTLSSTFNPTSSVYNYSFNLGAEALGGDIQGSILGSYSANSTNFITNGLRWRYVIRENPFISTVQAGQNSSDGLINRNYTGLKITNDPIEPRIVFDEYVIDGNTVPQSEVELYLNNSLIDFEVADELGNYRFVIPLSYGGARFRTMIYKPNGQIEQLNRRIQIPYTFLPPGEITYHINAGVTDNPVFTAASGNRRNIMGQSNVRYGFTEWLTGTFGAEYIHGIDDKQPLFYSSLSSRIAQEYLVNVNISPNAFYQVSTNAVFPSSASYSLDYTLFTGASIFNRNNIDQQIKGSIFLPFSLGNMPLNFRIAGDRKYVGDFYDTRYRVDFTTRISKMSLRFGFVDRQIGPLDIEVSPGARLVGSASYSISRIPGIPTYLKGTYLRTQVDYIPDISTIEKAAFQLSKDLSNSGRLQLSFGKNFLGDFLTANLNISFDLSFTRSTSSARMLNESYNITQNFRGSVGYDSYNSELFFSNRQQVGRSAASVRLFVDENNSGDFEAGEEIIKDKAIRVGRSAETKMNDEGLIRLLRLQSYNRINLEVNQAAITNPLLIPIKDKFSFVTDPNQFKPIGIPFYRSGVIDGQVMKQLNDSSRQGMAGVRLYLEKTENTFSKELRTFSDGSFYTYEVPPGKYRLYVDPNQLEFLNATVKPDTLKFEVKTLAEGDFIEGLSFVVHPDQTSREAITDNTTASADQGRSNRFPDNSVFQVQLGSYSSVSTAAKAAQIAQQQFGVKVSVIKNTSNNYYAVRTRTQSDPQVALSTYYKVSNSQFIDPALVVIDYGSQEGLDQETNRLAAIKIGAFEKQFDANKFASLSAIKLNMETEVSYNSNQGEYEVFVAPAVDDTLSIAQQLNQIRQNTFYKNAFVVNRSTEQFTDEEKSFNFAYQVQIEGITEQSEQAFLSSLASGSDSRLNSSPKEDVVIFDEIKTWKSALDLKKKLEQVSDVGKPILILLERNGRNNRK